jgi:hypothetical protein
VGNVDVMRDEAGFVRCDHCGDRIGIYEPAIWVDPDGKATEAEPDVDPAEPQRPVHRHCYEGLQ